MATVHMISGYLGAGKTTFARKVEKRERALRFSVDEMYLRLFSQGPTYELDQDAMERLLAVIEEQWVRAVSMGISVVLDLGFWHRALREKTRERAEALGADVRLYWVKCTDESALARCLERNGQDGAFLISPEGYKALKAYFEAPKEEEGPRVIDTESTPGGGVARGTDGSECRGGDELGGVLVAPYEHELDCEEVVALWSEVFAGDPSHNEPRALIERKRRYLPELFLVARREGRVVGTIVGGYDGVRGWMHHLATHPAQRRQGVARRLVSELEVHLRTLGCVKLNLQVRAGNTAVIGFYEGLGYEREPRESLGKRL